MKGVNGLVHHAGKIIQSSLTPSTVTGTGPEHTGEDVDDGRGYALMTWFKELRMGPKPKMYATMVAMTLAPM